MENNDSSSGVNTILIVIVLVLLVGFGVWWFTAHKGSSNDGGANINVTLPTGGDSGTSGGAAQ